MKDKWRHGQNTPKYNQSADSRTHSERLNDLNTRAQHLPNKERELYQHMVERQEREYNELLTHQESKHRGELEGLISDFLKDKEGFNLDRTSPGIRREHSEKKAVRLMAERENNEQNRYLKSYLTQREGFVKYNEMEVAKRLAKQDKQAQKTKKEGKEL